MTGKPSDLELEICKTFKEREFSKLLNLKYVLLIGNAAVRQMLGYSFSSLTIVNGKMIEKEINGNLVKFFLIHHPGYILRKGKVVKKEVVKALDYFKTLIEE